MRYLWLLLIPFLCGFTRVHWEYSKPEDIKDEFQNLEIAVQDKQFRTVYSTPSLGSLQDREVVISSGDVNGLMFRNGQEIYFIKFSCVTITR